MRYCSWIWLTFFVVAVATAISGCGKEAESVSSVTTLPDDPCIQGKIIATGQQLDLAVSGLGFFQLMQPDGSLVYSRDGFFTLNQQGVVVNRYGASVWPLLQFPRGTTSIVVDAKGTVSYKLADGTGSTAVGTLQLAAFSNPGKLDYVYENTFTQSALSGSLILSAPDSNGMGSVAQAYLEVPPKCGTYRTANNTVLNCKQNNFATTRQQLDVAIAGRGFFQIQLSDGSIAYTRNGHFVINVDNKLATADGYLLQPEIVIPADISQVVISTAGVVSYQSGEPASVIIAGNITLADFINPQGLTASSTASVLESADGTLSPIGYLLESVQSGTPVIAPPGSDSMGTLQQYKLEYPPGCSSYRTVTPEVVPALPNSAPVANAGADKSAVSGEIVTLAGSGQDNEGTVTFTWRQISGAVIGTITDSQTATASFVAPTATAASTLILELNVTDSEGVIASDTVSVSVTPKSNQSPVAIAGNDKMVASGSVVTLSGTGSDNDGSIVGYQWSQTSGTSVTLLDSDKDTASFVAPTVTADTTLTFQLLVTDDRNGTAVDTIATIVLPNQNPIAIAGNDQTVVGAASVTFSGSASDSDGSIASYKWTQLSGAEVVTLLNADTATASFVAPDVLSETILEFRLTVTDNLGGSGTDTLQVIVTPKPNLAPVANAGLDQTVTANSTVTLLGLGLDSDGTIASYEWKQVSGPIVTIKALDNFAASFIAPAITAAEIFTFAITVVDDRGATATDTVAISVTP